VRLYHIRRQNGINDSKNLTITRNYTSRKGRVL